MRPLVFLLWISWLAWARPALTACAAGQFRPPGAAECRPCAACEVGEQFALRPCDDAHDTVCANCTECPEAQAFERGACDGERDTACQPCAQCETGRTFAAVECGLDTDRACAPCTRCASMELRPCDAARDAECGTRLVLRFESEQPPSAFTRAMLSALAAAVAQGLGLPEAAVVEASAAAYRRLFRVQVDLTLRAEVNASRIEAVDWDAVARASGLPIQRLSATLASANTASQGAAQPVLTALWVWLGVVALLVLCGCACAPRRRTRVAHSEDAFTDLFAAAIIQTAPPRRRARP